LKNDSLSARHRATPGGNLAITFFGEQKFISAQSSSCPRGKWGMRDALFLNLHTPWYFTLTFTPAGHEVKG